MQVTYATIEGDTITFYPAFSDSIDQLVFTYFWSLAVKQLWGTEWMPAIGVATVSKRKILGDNEVVMDKLLKGIMKYSDRYKWRYYDEKSNSPYIFTINP